MEKMRVKISDKAKNKTFQRRKSILNIKLEKMSDAFASS